MKTPMPADGEALGPQAEWTGSQPNDYNLFNKGDAYTKNAVTGPFTLTFDVELDQRFVQPDNGEPHEQTPDGDARLLSFVANSGVKIGAIVEDPLVDTDTREEVAIIDIKRLVDRVGELDTFNHSSVWDVESGKVSVTYDNITYDAEELTRLLPGILYNLAVPSYGDMFDLSVHDNNTRVGQPTTWQDYYKILSDFYGFFGDLGNPYEMKIENTTSTLTVSVLKDGGYVKIYEGSAITGDSQLHLQCHWGIGVTFSNIVIND
ncbi:MAG: hypothetical protein R6U98_22205 [Pirellulaceae bacterium]